MGEYGVTKQGYVLKRQDTIYNDIADRVQRYAGIDIAKKSDSVLNLAIFMPISDLIAQLHEECLDVYNSLHPSTAEGVALDDACQFGNVRREAARKTVYQISCNMTDGNTLLAGTIIAADTNPRHDLLCDADTVVSRDAFNEAYIRLVVAASGVTYEVQIDDEKYTYISDGTDAEAILQGISDVIKTDCINKSIQDGILVLRCKKPEELHSMKLSESLTTESVTGLVKFSTAEYGAIILPDNTITNIISNSSTGFNWCDNRIDPIAGCLATPDYEYRQDYIAQIYSNASNMKESIRSYLLQHVENIISVNVYENYTDTIDSEGRLPHSIEVIAEGGKDDDIAYGILARRAGGIQTNGDVSVQCEGENGTIIEIRFNRPVSVYAWLSVTLSGDKASIPSNYVRLVTDLAMERYGSLTAGESLYNQTLIGAIYSKIPGLSRVEVKQYHSSNSGAVPQEHEYTDDNIIAKKREKIVIAENRIKVVIA